MINKEKSFSLIELIAAVVIIGILVTIALPQFIKSVEKTRQAEAIATLTRMYRGYKELIIDEIIDANGNFINGSAAALFNPDESDTSPNNPTGRSDLSWKAWGFAQNINYEYNNLYFSYDFLKAGESSVTGTGRSGSGRPPSSADVIGVAWRKTSNSKPWSELFPVDFNKYIFMYMNNGTIVKSSDYK